MDGDGYTWANVAPGFLYIQGGDVRVVITYLIEIGELLSLIFYAH